MSDRLRAWLQPARIVCPRCGSARTDAVAVPGDATRPFRRAVPEPDGPAYGCTSCRYTWGRWGDEFADGRL